MNYRSFRSIRVSEVGLGCWAIGGNAYGNSYGATDDAESIKAIKKALMLGCNFFDTADVYGHGHSEEMLGVALASSRQDVMIATKVGGAYMYGGEWGGMNFSEEYVRFALEQSMRRLRTNYIDVYQLHNPPYETIKEGEIFQPLRRLQQEGRIRFAGISVHTLDEGLAALEHADSVQCVFNMLDPRNYELMETAKRRGIAVICREPLANGFLTGKYTAASGFEPGDIRSRFPRYYLEEIAAEVDELKKKFVHRNGTLAQLALKYVLSFDSVTAVIPGAKTEKQVEENIAASDMPPLTEAELRSLGA